MSWKKYEARENSEDREYMRALKIISEKLNSVLGEIAQIDEMSAEHEYIQDIVLFAIPKLEDKRFNIVCERYLEEDSDV